MWPLTRCSVVYFCCLYRLPYHAEFRRVCYRINGIRTFCSGIFAPWPSLPGTKVPGNFCSRERMYKFGTGVIWEGYRRSGVALAMRQTPWFIHLRAQWLKTGRWALTPMTLRGMALFTFICLLEGLRSSNSCSDLTVDAVISLWFCHEYCDCHRSLPRFLPFCWGFLSSLKDDRRCHN